MCQRRGTNGSSTRYARSPGRGSGARQNCRRGGRGGSRAIRPKTQARRAVKTTGPEGREVSLGPSSVHRRLSRPGGPWRQDSVELARRRILEEVREGHGEYLRLEGPMRGEDNRIAAIVQPEKTIGMHQARRAPTRAGATGRGDDSRAARSVAVGMRGCGATVRFVCLCLVHCVLVTRHEVPVHRSRPAPRVAGARGRALAVGRACAGRVRRCVRRATHGPAGVKRAGQKA